jgi:hypothetical protein
MDYEKIFDLLMHMTDDETKGSAYQFPISPKKTAKINTAQQMEIVNRSIQAFIFGINGKPKGDKEKEGRIQAFFGSSDLPILTKDVFNVTSQVPIYDILWQEAFKGVPLKKGQLSWEIATVGNSGVGFLAIPEGGKVEFNKFTGSKISVNIQKYGMGLGITWETIHGRKLYRFVEQLETVRSNLYTLWANIHYGLLATAGATNQVTYQGNTEQSKIDRDIQTINYGYNALATAVKDSGYGDVANSEMILYHGTALKGRIGRALRATDRDKYAQSSGVAATAGDSGALIEFNVTSRTTLNSNVPANKALLVLPGHKIQNSVYLREMGLAKQDIETLNELRTYWTAFGAAIGDNDQVYELAFA